MKTTKTICPMGMSGATVLHPIGEGIIYLETS